MPLPESRQGGQVMGGHRGHGPGRVGLRGQKVAIPVPFKIKDPVGKDAGLAQVPPDAGRHGAQVLPDDQGSPAHALQGQDGQEFPGRVGDIGAPGRLRPWGIHSRRNSPMTWSIRSMPPGGMLARRVSMNNW